MEEAPPPIPPALDAALTRWEAHGRPGVPQNGFALGRRPGRSRRGIYRADTGAAVLEPDGHILRMSPAPDGRRIGVQLADRADEEAVVGVVDSAAGTLRLYPEFRCRYDPMLWRGDSSALELVAGRTGSLIRIDAHTGSASASPLPQDGRFRLFPGGPCGLLAERRLGGPTRLRERSTGREVAAFSAVLRVLPLGEAVLVDDGAGLTALDPRDGTAHWRWEDPQVRITALATRGEAVLAAGVRAGRSVLLRISRGAVDAEAAVSYRGQPAVAADVSADAGGFHVLLEGPALPPRAVHAAELLRPDPASGAPLRTPAHTEWHTATADDGAPVRVAVTSPAGAVGPLPTILTCYGGFGVPALPVFEPTVPAWIEHGGRYAVAQVRGGGEHGGAWRRAGSGARKERAVEDLAAAARGLASAGLTRPGSLVLAGASHGGVLAAACALRSPGLCSGVVSTAAPLDLLGLSAHPLGANWAAEFGAADTAEGRSRLRRISPLHLAQALAPGGAAPRFLGIAAAEDSRVAARDTRAVVAALQRAGADAAFWSAPHMGHGSNHLEQLHAFGAAVLGFAAASTSTPPSSREGSGRG
ncbi:prolyl oligopeptidase family serine peptidase [Nocardiopsis coralliicola]